MMPASSVGALHGGRARTSPSPHGPIADRAATGHSGEMADDRNLRLDLLSELDAIAREQESLGPRDQEHLESLRRRVDRVKDRVQQARRPDDRAKDR
jgi:hypothetical protein